MHTASAIALHVEAAKRLLVEIEEHAASALFALGRENGTEFFAAVNEREQVLAQLDEVVEALAHERASGGQGDEPDAATAVLLAEMAQAAAAALESHEQLLAQTRRERDRLASALNRSTRPDSVANHYAAAVISSRPRTFSATG